MKRLTTHGLAAASLRLLVPAAAALVLAGCGDGRVEVRGKVTFQGKPVPVGSITFEPVKELGNVSAGFAVIQNGEFVTQKGRGCAADRYLARLKGYDDTPSPQAEALAAERISGFEDDPPLAIGRPLFENLLIPVEVTGNATALEFHLPLEGSAESPAAR